MGCVETLVFKVQGPKLRGGDEFTEEDDEKVGGHSPSCTRHI